MTIPLTLIGPGRSTDVVLPAHTPLAVLSHDLAELTGAQPGRLRTLTGRALDPALGLVDNGIRGGSLLLTASVDAPAEELDDVAEVAALQDTGGEQWLDRRGVALGVGVAAAAGLAAQLAEPGPIALTCLAAVIAWVLLPRVVLRAARLDAATNPLEAGVPERVRSARAATLLIGRILAAGVLAGSTVLAGGLGTSIEPGVAPGPACAVAGWLGLLTVAFRVTGRDRAVSLGVVVATGAVLALRLPGQATADLCIAVAGALAVGAALGGGGRRPFARVLRQGADRLVAVVLPIALLAASGLLPGLPG